jgi:hypothetical protein
VRRQDRHTGCWREKLVSRSGRTATESCSRCRDRHPGRGGLPHQSDLGRAEFCGWGFIHHSSFFLLPSPGLGANRAVVPKPSPEGNRCKLRHEAPKALQKALYVGCSERGRPLQVVYFGWSRFPGPGSAPRIYALPIYGGPEWQNSERQGISYEQYSGSDYGPSRGAARKARFTIIHPPDKHCCSGRAGQERPA